MRTLYKIVHTSGRTCWEDPEKRILEEAVWMEARGHKVVIIAPGKSPLYQNARNRGLAVYALSFKGIARMREARELVDILANEQPYVLNAHGRVDGSIALKAGQKAGVPCRIISRHTGARLRNTLQNRSIYRKLSHYVFTDSDFITGHLKGTFKLRDMDVLTMPGGVVPPGALLSKPDAASWMAEQLGLPQGERFIGCLSPVAGQKDEADLLNITEAFRKILAEIPHHLVIQAEPDRIPDLARKLKNRCRTNRIHLIRPVNDTWRFYRALGCGILPPALRNGQPAEGVPRRLVKAMFSSCPVISSPAGGITDLLIHGRTGFLSEQGDRDGLASLIVATLTRDAATKERTHAARETVKNHYTIDTMGRNVIRIYRLHQVKLDKQRLPDAFRQA